MIQFNVALRGPDPSSYGKHHHRGLVIREPPLLRDVSEAIPGTEARLRFAKSAEASYPCGILVFSFPGTNTPAFILTQPSVYFPSEELNTLERIMDSIRSDMNGKWSE